VITDRPLLSDRMDIPEGVVVVRLDDYLPPASSEKRRRFLLYGLIESIRPQVFHNINSETAWKLIIEEGVSLQRKTYIIGSIFAFSVSAGWS